MSDASQFLDLAEEELVASHVVVEYHLGLIHRMIQKGAALFK
ncbi:hypothetical protein [Adonisia turfae]|nr:hypothetical protein [Adonisia turfae]